MNKILRTLLLVIVALGLVLTIAACNNDKPGTTTTAPKGTTVAPGTGDNTTTAPKGTTTAPVTGDNTTTPNVTTVAPPTTTTPKGTTAGEPSVEYPYVDGSHEINVDANGNLVYTKLEDWGKDLVIGNADETPYGTYTVTLTNWVKAQNWVGYFFAGTDNGAGIWNKPAQAYVVAMREFDNALVLHRLNCEDWKAEDTKVMANVEGYKNGKAITIKSVFYPDGDGAKIDIYYLFGDSTEFVFAGTYTDANPFTGTEYGIKMSQRESTAKEFSYAALEDPKAEDFGYVIEHQQEANPVKVNHNGTIIGGNGSIVLKQTPAATAAGVYTLKYTNMAEKDSGLVLAHTRTGDATWEGAGTSYYFIFVSPQGVYLGKAYNNAEGKGAWAALKNDGAALIEGFTKEGDHELVVAYDGEGTFNITLDGVFLYTVTDDAPLTGTGYGFRAGINGPVLKSVDYKGFTADDFGYVIEHQQAANPVKFNMDGTINGGEGSIILKKNPAPTAAGVYTLKYTNTAEGDQGLVIAHTRTGDATWEGTGTFYYFIFVSPQGVYLGKVYNNAEGKGAWAALKNDGAALIEGFTKEGEHELVVEYDGKGTFGITLDGTFLYNVTDDAPLTGTGYGYRAGKNGSVVESVDYAGFTPEAFGYRIEHEQAANPVKFNMDGTFVGGDGSIVLKQNPATSAAGIYNLKFTNIAERDSGLVLAHTRTGNATWEGTGTFYYFIFVSPQGVYLGKVYNNAEGKGAWAALKNEGANKIEGFTKEGEHELEVYYDGNGYFEITLDGTFLYNVTDTAPLTGTGYGFRAGGNGPVVESIEYTPMWDVVKGAENATLGADGSVSATGAYTALSNEKTDSVFGTYTLDIENTESGRNGLVFGYSETDGVESYAFFWVNHDIAILNHTNIGGNANKDVAFESSAWAWNGAAFSRAGRHQLTVSVADAGEGNATYKTYYDGTLIKVWTGAAPTGTGYGIKAEQGNIKAYSVTYTPEIRPEAAGANGNWFADTAEGVYTSATHAAIKVVGNAANVVGTYKATMTTPNHAVNSDSGLIFCASDDNDDGKFWEAEGLYYFLMVSDNADIALVRVGADTGAWNHVGSGGKILNFRHGDTINLAAVVYADGTIEIYANDILYITWKDEALLTGTGYGVRAEVGGTTFTNVSYSETAEAITAPATREDIGAYSKFTYADGTVEYMTKTYWNGSLKLGDVTGTHSTYEFTLRNGNTADNMINFYIAGDDAAGQGTDVWAGSAYAIGFHNNGALAITKLVGTSWAGQEKVWDGSYVTPGYELVDELNVKVDYNLVNGVATIKIWVKGPVDADYVLAAEVVDNTPLTGKAYGLKMPIGGSVCSNIKVTNVPTFVVKPDDSEDAA